MTELRDAKGKIQHIDLKIDFLEAHRQLAEANRKRLDEHGVTMIDIMGSVGAGKTSIVEQLVRNLKEKYRIVVLNGDLATTIDQDRILRYGVEAIQVNTGKDCHLDAALVGAVLERFDLENLDLVIVENVGNLICPADFPLGSHKRVVVTSVTEGPYVALKHPHVFSEMDYVVINKIDLATVMDVDVSRLVQDLKSVNPRAIVIQTSCKDGTGISDLIAQLVG